jgi:hypothetical protein
MMILCRCYSKMGLLVNANSDFKGTLATFIARALSFGDRRIFWKGNMVAISPPHSHTDDDDPLC